MNEANLREHCLSKLEPYGQQHLIQFWDELDPSEKKHLADQIDGIDLEQITSLFRGDIDQPDWEALSHQASPPPAVRLTDRRSGSGGDLGIKPSVARRRAEQAMRAGEVGVILTAGGQGSRLGFEKPKGLYPIGPISGASLLQIHIEKVRALALRYDKKVPLYLMTSPATYQDTIDFLNENENFGLEDDDLIVFSQGTMPAVDQQTGKILLSEKHKLFLSPDGHGGTVAALGDSQVIQHIHHRGIQHLFYLQVDNPLVPICDLELLGYHLMADSQLTSIAIAKQDPKEKLGCFAMIDDALHVIEYSDFPEEIAELRCASGGLKFWAGSIAVHIFNLTLLEQALELTHTLPYHVAKKKVPYIDTTGTRVEPQDSNALKYEKFIFDLLPVARQPIVVEYAEQDCFAPLKNAPGAPKDTAEYVQQMMLAEHRSWLEAAGAKVDHDVSIEICPLYALDAVGVAQSVQEGQVISESQYLQN